jgi:two-component system torCAD operon response regulator TorR
MGEESGRVLVVEDDPVFRTLIVAHLRAARFQVSAAGSCAEARERAVADRPEVILVDLVLPDGDGLALATELRSIGDAGIIFVTARDDPEDRVRALDLGGDDYIVKPPHHRELLARVRAVLRRRSPSPAGERLGPWRLDTASRLVVHSSGAVPSLTRGEFDILSALLAARGCVVDRATLYTSLLGRRSSEADRTVDALVSRLRRKLREIDPFEVIQTVPGLGYRSTL